MQPFGKKHSEAPDEGASDGQYLRTFKKGDTLVRFVEECDDWILFKEHYNHEGRAFPCTEDRSTCPGCNDEDDRVSKWSRRYGANLLVIREKGDHYVAPYRIPIGLAQSMFERSERNEGTVLNRDYLIIRSGSGLTTNYDVDSGDKYAIDLKKWRRDMSDVQEILGAMFEENAPALVSEGRRRRASEDDEEPRAKRRPRADDTADADEKPRRRRAEPEDEDPDEEPPAKPPRASRAKPAAKAKPEPEDVEDNDDDPPSEPDVDDSGDDSGEEIDEEALYEMTPADLRALAARKGIEVDGGARKSDLIKALSAAAE